MLRCLFNCFVSLGLILHTASSIPISMRDPLSFLMERGLRNGFDVACDVIEDKVTFFGSNNIGQYVPQCDEEDKTKFKLLQCHGSTGYCWCASSNGKAESEQFRFWESADTNCKK